MPSFDVALIELGKLLGFFDSTGSVSWSWFGDPIGTGFTTLPAERERIGAIIRALLDRPSPTGEFSTDSNWEPVLDTTSVDLGFTWTKASDLQLGLGAKVNVPIDGKQINLAALARLIRIVGSNVTPELGQAKLTGTFPVPNFLSAGELNLDITAGPTLAVGLKATDNQAQSRQLDFPNPVLAWDAARLALFVLKAWIKQRADANETFFKRINDHLFPMMGDPAGAIQPFPLVAPMKTAPNFDAWRDSVLTTNNNASGALTFLWHLRALLTGNESPNFLQSSFFFPLSGAIQSGAPPTLADVTGPYNRPQGQTGAWVGVLTDDPVAGTFTLVLDLETASPLTPRTARIPLVTFDGANFQRPPLAASAQNLWSQIVQDIVASPGLSIGTELIKAVTAGPGFKLSILRTTVAASGFTGFDGNYDLAIYVEEGQQPRILLETPVLPITFPPDLNNPDKLLGDVAVWALKAAAPGNDIGQLINSAAEFIRKTATSTVTTSDGVDLLTKVVGAAAQGQEIEIPIGSDAAVNIAVKNGKVEAGVEFGPIEQDAIPIYVGRLSGGLIINPAASPYLDGFTFGFENLRLSNSSAGSGIVASLIPDMRQFPGFHFNLSYSSSTQKLLVAGGGKIPIQRNIGPLEIAALMVDVRPESFSAALDLTFQLAAITVAAYELGITYNFKTGSVAPFLHGLALSMDTSVIKLAGFFGAIETNGVTDYVGGATVSIAGYFELSAIGGYTQLNDPDKTTSLFLFASLVAPLGGPPWFFITGVAGGFGYNRSLPAPGLLLDHPFLLVMRGEIAIGANAGEALRTLSIHFAAVKGQHWIAAGIQFTAFGFINGKVVIAIAFGNKFSFTILGMASFGIPPICYFEIGIEATADEEKFLLRARLSPNSYVIHPDIFSLQGDFALGAWYKAPHKGDFLFSIGGYHPLFAKPEHYPELIRVGCKAVIYSFVHLSVEVFFSCTPQALMAGASVSLWAEFMGIAAGLDVYVDVLMKWDPFYLLARMGIHIWFEFFGRHEIGVDLEVWTPEFGGRATIDLALVSFDVEFGSQNGQTKVIPVPDFVNKQLGVEADAAGDTARPLALSTAAGTGLFRIDILTGRPGKEQPPKDEQQEGLDPAKPIHLNPEWKFSAKTRIPLGGIDAASATPPSFTGLVDLPLCGKTDQSSTVTVDVIRLNSSNVQVPISNTKRSWLADYFPVAQFGEPVPEAQAGGSARDSVASLKTDEPSIPLIEGATFDYPPTIPAPPAALEASTGEPSDPDESYPVPLGIAAPGPALSDIKNKYIFAGASHLPVKFAQDIDRRASAIADLSSPRRRPFTVGILSAEVQRFTALAAAVTFTIQVPTNTPVIAPPPSPARPQEMFGVQLRTLQTRSNEPVRKRQLEARNSPRSLKKTLATPRPVDSFQTTLTVAAGRATQIEFGAGGIRSALLRGTGDQTVRTVVIDRGGNPILDTYQRGPFNTKVPAGAARALLIGEGLTQSPANAGVERESILLAAGNRLFIGHSCSISVLSTAPIGADPMDSLPGAELFDNVSSYRIYFNKPVRDEGAFVLRVVPVVDRPAPAVEQVRWLATGARFRNLVPVVAADRIALVMSVVAEGPWSVDIDLGPEWKLDGAVLLPRNARLVATEMQSNPTWDQIDDSMPAHPRGLASTVSLEARS